MSDNNIQPIDSSVNKNPQESLQSAPGASPTWTQEIDAYLDRSESVTTLPDAARNPFEAEPLEREAIAAEGGDTSFDVHTSEISPQFRPPKKSLKGYHFDPAKGQIELARVKLCGKTVRIVTHLTCGAKVWHVNRCKSRFCQICARAESARLVEKWLPAINRFKYPAIFTVSQGVRCADSKLPGAIQNLLKGFERLRRSKIWRGGPGIWKLEVTHNARGWHPHLHILIDWRYIDFKELSKTWTKITGAKHKPDLAPLREEQGRRAGAMEVLKYLSKDWRLPESKRVVLAGILARRKVVQPFGKLRVPKKKKDPLCCPRCGERFRFSADWQYRDEDREGFVKKLRGVMWADFFTGWNGADPRASPAAP